MIIISHEGRFWTNFQMLCSVLCLVSSYYYCSIMCHRYAFMDQMEDGHLTLIVVFESIFLVRIFLSFFVDYKVEGSTQAVSDLPTIASNYLNTDFLWDFILVLPLQFIPMYRRRQYLFYLLKIFRIPQGLELYNV